MRSHALESSFFQLAEGSENGKNHATTECAGIHALLLEEQINLQRLKLIQNFDQVLKTSSQSVD